MSFILTIVIIIAALMIIGVLLWALNNLPFIDPAMASIARVLIIVVTVIALALWLISIASGAPIGTLR